MHPGQLQDEEHAQVLMCRDGNDCAGGILPTCSVKKSKTKKRKDSAGSDDTASKIKGGGYLGARTRQPPAHRANKEFNVGQGGCVP